MQYNSSPHTDDGYLWGADFPKPVTFSKSEPPSGCLSLTCKPEGEFPLREHSDEQVSILGSKSPVSEYVDGSPSGRSPHSDEEMMVTLASSRPKKPAGRKKFKETRHPVYRGVRKRNKDKWVCELREPNKKTRLWLGTYPTAEMAARAHDVAALALKGESTGPCLNFADSVWRLPVPVSKEAEHIRQAAAEAAEAFRPLLPPAVVVSPDVSRSDDGIVEDFDMEELILNMAEGPLLSPSPSSTGRGFSWDDVGSDVEVSLWS